MKKLLLILGVSLLTGCAYLSGITGKTVYDKLYSGAVAIEIALDSATAQCKNLTVAEKQTVTDILSPPMAALQAAVAFIELNDIDGAESQAELINMGLSTVLVLLNNQATRSEAIPLMDYKPQRLGVAEANIIIAGINFILQWRETSVTGGADLTDVKVRAIIVLDKYEIWRNC